MHKFHKPSRSSESLPFIKVSQPHGNNLNVALRVSRFSNYVFMQSQSIKIKKRLPHQPKFDFSATPQQRLGNYFVNINTDTAENDNILSNHLNITAYSEIETPSELNKSPSFILRNSESPNRFKKCIEIDSVSGQTRQKSITNLVMPAIKNPSNSSILDKKNMKKTKATPFLNVSQMTLSYQKSPKKERNEESPIRLRRKLIVEDPEYLSFDNSLIDNKKKTFPLDSISIKKKLAIKKSKANDEKRVKKKNSLSSWDALTNRLSSASNFILA
ncbi:unnamed protein product [Blepharisma stoltei]|uniref:Uncharacterized protein n=1 Tax=Blepharisma stoltei TaxID=1481888 RepID=A0AAU9IV91_9CILI|nr:unnamed protein product [Blepharisma stoltei]